MDAPQLSRKASTLLRVLYKEYSRRKKQGLTKIQASCFAGSDFVQSQFLKKWTVEDVDEACRELRKAKLLNCLFLDNSVGEIWLPDAGITYMDNRFSSGIKRVFYWIEQLRSILPW